MNTLLRFPIRSRAIVDTARHIPTLVVVYGALLVLCAVVFQYTEHVGKALFITAFPAIFLAGAHLAVTDARVSLVQKLTPVLEVGTVMGVLVGSLLNITGKHWSTSLELGGFVFMAGICFAVLIKLPKAP